MTRNRICWGVILLITLAVFIFTNTYYTFFFLIALIVAPVISFVFLRMSVGSLKLDVQAPAGAEKGEHLRVEVRIGSEAAFSIASMSLDVVAESQLTGARHILPAQLSVRRKKTSELEFEIEQATVGAMMIKAENVRIYDVFRLFCIRRPEQAEAVTVIWPHFRELEVYVDKPVETIDEGIRFSDRKKGNDVSEIFSMREYEPGDEIRRIHWKLSSKLDKTILREYSRPLNYSVFLLLELAPADEVVMDRAVELYISVSRILMEKGVNHNLAWVNGSEMSLHVAEPATIEEMELVHAQLLNSYAQEGRTTAIDAYMESVHFNSRNTFIYIATEVDEEKVMMVRAVQKAGVLDASAADEINEIWL